MSRDREETTLREDLERYVALELSANAAHVAALEGVSKATATAEETVAAVIATAVASGVSEVEAAERLDTAMRVVVPQAIKSAVAEEERTREELSEAAKKSATKGAEIETLVKELMGAEARQLDARLKAEAATKVAPLQVTIGIFRSAGWLVEAHHDSMHEGKLRTTWILVKGSAIIRGYGPDDCAALESIRSAVMAPTKDSSDGVAAEPG